MFGMGLPIGTKEVEITGAEKPNAFFFFVFGNIHIKYIRNQVNKGDSQTPNKRSRSTKWLGLRFPVVSTDEFVCVDGVAGDCCDITVDIAEEGEIETLDASGVTICELLEDGPEFKVLD